MNLMKFSYGVGSVLCPRMFAMSQSGCWGSNLGLSVPMSLRPHAVRESELLLWLQTHTNLVPEPHVSCVQSMYHIHRTVSPYFNFLNFRASTDNIAGKVLNLHTASPDSIPSIPYGPTPTSLPGVIHEYRARSKS